MKRAVLFIVIGLLIPICSNAQYTPLNVSSSSNTRTYNSNYSEDLSYISATVGINGNWTFKFYSNGSFQSHVWYGDYGKYSTRGNMKKESYSNGTYTIKEEDGETFVYFRYANGAKEYARLRYKGERLELLTPSGAADKIHKEM